MSKNKTEIKETVIEVKKESKAKPNIAISEDTLTWIQSLKLIPQEPYDSVLQRIKKQITPEIKPVIVPAENKPVIVEGTGST